MIFHHILQSTAFIAVHESAVFGKRFLIPDEPVELTPEEMKREEALKKRRIYQRRKRKEKRLAKEADEQMT